MIRVTLITMGRLKEKYLKEACNEYIKRLARFCKLDLIELEPVKLNDNASDAEISASLKKEATEIIKRIPSKSYTIALCVEGNKTDSIKFSELLNRATMEYSNITLIIGSSYGLSDEIKKLSNYTLSISEMTFPHQLFRVMLLEQVYRAFKISSGETYHK